MLCPELIRGLSLDESIIFCETLPIQLALADDPGAEVQVMRLASESKTKRDRPDG
jgi:hypothetical protein